MPRLALALALVAACPSMAAALPLPFSEAASIGRPARSVTIVVEPTEDGVVVRARGAGREAPATLVIEGIDDVTVERVEVAAQDYVAVVRGTGAGHTFAALVTLHRGAASVPWIARTDLHGDPGERTAGRIELTDRTADGHPDVVIGTVAEGAAVCGQQQTLLFPRAWDPSSGQLRPVELARLGDGAETVVQATRTSPGPTGAPLIRALGASGASSRSGREETDPAAVAPPNALFDGRLDTFWAEGRGGPGRHEFASGRWSAGLPIRAFAVVLSPSGEVASRLGRPSAFWLVGDDGERLRVEVPEDSVGHPGERYWVVPPAPVDWHCVSLVLGDAHAPAGTPAAAVHTGVAELEAYTGLDWGDGLDGLVSILVEGGRTGDEAARLLSQLGEPAVTAVAAAWDRLDPQGRRRAVRVLASAGGSDSADAIAALERAAADDTEEVRAAALEALGTLGPPAGEALARLIVADGPAGDDAVRPLLRHPVAVAVPALLGAIAGDGGSERPALRDGLAQAVGTDDDARELLAAWLAADPALPAQASAAQGLASRAETRALAAPMVRALGPRATQFEDRWRLVRAAAVLEPDPNVDTWLGSIATDAEEWMLRAAAVAAMGRRSAPEREAVARQALADPYPRVRVTAVEILDGLNVADDQLVRLASHDSWPMVRAASLTALFDRPAGREAILAGIGDHSPRVRHAALAATTRGGVRQPALPLVIGRLEDDDEWPRVTLEALRWVSELCVEDAGEAVVGVIRRGVRPGAWAPDVDVAAVAADLAIRLGGETARDAEAIAQRAGAPESVRVAVERRLAEPRPCTGASSP
ncbi:MAG: HEAT repeat domain-containing protein [Sandaracinaceae bacterium]|nr:HEAT repeat domain-containing protein [Sandaracinaceae bacterium]